MLKTLIIAAALMLSAHASAGRFDHCHTDTECEALLTDEERAELYKERTERRAQRERKQQEQTK